MIYFGRLLAALIAIALSVTAASADTYYYIQGKNTNDAVQNSFDLNQSRLELYSPGGIDRHAGDCTGSDVTGCVGGLFWSVLQPATDDWTGTSGACGTHCSGTNFNTYTNLNFAGYGNYNSSTLNGFTTDSANVGGTGSECASSLQCNGQNFGFIFAPLEVGTGGNSALTTIYTFALHNNFAGGETPWASTNDLVVSMHEAVTYAGFDTSCATIPNTIADCGNTIAYVTGIIEDTNKNTIFLSGRANVAFTTTATDNPIFQAFNGTTQGYINTITAGSSYQVFFDVANTNTRYGSACDATTFSSTLAGNPGGVYCIRISSTQLKNIVDDLNSTYSQTFSDTASNWHLMAVEADVEVWDWNGLQQAAKCGAHGNSNCDNKMGFITDSLTAQIVPHANTSPTVPIYMWSQTTVANTVETFLYTAQGGAASPWFAYSGTDYYPGIYWYAYRTNPGTGYTLINVCENNTDVWDFMPENGSCPSGYTQFGKIGYLANSSGGSNTNAINRCHWAGTGQLHNSSHLIVFGSDSSICTGGSGWTHDKTIGYAPSS